MPYPASDVPMDKNAQARRAGLRKGTWLLAGGLALAVASYLPLQFSIWFGPKDANPIGFGLLLVFGTPVGLILAACGALYLAITLLVTRRP